MSSVHENKHTLSRLSSLLYSLWVVAKYRPSGLSCYFDPFRRYMVFPDCPRQKWMPELSRWLRSITLQYAPTSRHVDPKKGAQRQSLSTQWWMQVQVFICNDVKEHPLAHYKSCAETAVCGYNKTYIHEGNIRGRKPRTRMDMLNFAFTRFGRITGMHISPSQRYDKI